MRRFQKHLMAQRDTAVREPVWSHGGPCIPRSTCGCPASHAACGILLSRGRESTLVAFKPYRMAPVPALPFLLLFFLASGSMHAGLSAWPALLLPSTWLNLTHFPRLGLDHLSLPYPYAFSVPFPSWPSVPLPLLSVSAMVNLNAVE